jgi:hypothetical protein
MYLGAKTPPPWLSAISVPIYAGFVTVTPSTKPTINAGSCKTMPNPLYLPLESTDKLMTNDSTSPFAKQTVILSVPQPSFLQNQLQYSIPCVLFF